MQGQAERLLLLVGELSLLLFETVGYGEDGLITPLVYDFAKRPAAGVVHVVGAELVRELLERGQVDAEAGKGHEPGGLEQIDDFLDRKVHDVRAPIEVDGNPDPRIWFACYERLGCHAKPPCKAPARGGAYDARCRCVKASVLVRTVVRLAEPDLKSASRIVDIAERAAIRLNRHPRTEWICQAGEESGR